MRLQKLYADIQILEYQIKNSINSEAAKKDELEITSINLNIDLIKKDVVRAIYTVPAKTLIDYLEALGEKGILSPARVEEYKGKAENIRNSPMSCAEKERREALDQVIDQLNDETASSGPQFPKWGDIEKSL